MLRLQISNKYLIEFLQYNMQFHDIYNSKQ